MYKAYLAGPDVFKPNAKEIGADLIRRCELCGIVGVFPLDIKIKEQGSQSKYQMGIEIAEANINAIKDCYIVIANLTPFRGPSADVGTVFECAFAKGLGKKVFGYSDYIYTEYKDRVIGKIPHDGMYIEDFETRDNIMISYGIDRWYSDFWTAVGDIGEMIKKGLI